MFYIIEIFNFTSIVISMSDHNFLKKYFLDFKKLIQEEKDILRI